MKNIAIFILAILHAILIIATLSVLTVNWGAASMCDEIPQVSQWKALCERGLMAVPTLMFFAIRSPQLLPRIFLWGVLATCAAESVLAIMQIHGVCPSGNNLFRLSGTFYNPGPLGGYLAAGLAPCLAEALSTSRRVARFAALAIMVTILTVLPATMSRTAWLAGLTGTVYVGLASSWGKGVVARLRTRALRFRLIGASVAFVIAVGVAFSLVLLKRDSALGRLFLWRISARAIADSPWTGHPSFGAAYAKAQEDYFATGGEPWEIRVADCPQYSFCEVLDVSVRHGLPLALLLAAVVGMAIVRGHRSGRHGLVGSLISLVVFSCGSYPLHLPAFVALGVLLVLGCLLPVGRWRMMVIPLSAACFGLCAHWLPTLAMRQEAMREWDLAKVSYGFHAYADACDRYAKLHDQLNWNPMFLSEYGLALHKTGQHATALGVLGEATAIGSDAMTLNTMGKCHQALGQYAEAEALFRRSALRLPNRLYPHHLLFLLYADSAVCDSAKQRREAETIMKMHVKVPSPAVDEMRASAEEFLNAKVQ